MPDGISDGSGSPPETRSDEPFSSIETLTERLRAAEAAIEELQAAAAEGQAKRRVFVEMCPFGIGLRNADGTLLQINQAYLDILGRKQEEFIADPDLWNRVSPPEYLARDGDLRLRLLRDGHIAPMEKEYLRPDGTRVLVLLAATYHRPSGELWAFVVDISDLKRAERALEESEERYRRIVETAQEGIWVLDAEARTTFVNPKMTEILGYAPEEFLGRHLLEFMDDAAGAEALERLEQRRQGQREQHDFRFRHKDGRDVWVLVNTNPLYDAEGRYAGAIGMMTDITMRREWEERMEEARRLEAVGRLAGGVAHEFNNLLTVINGYARLLLDELAPDDELRGMAEDISKAGDRAALLTSQLLAFGRKQMVRPRPFDLNGVLAQGERLLARLLGSKSELVIRPADRPMAIVADPAQIDQALLNLAVHAGDAMPRGGVLTLETQAVQVDDEMCRRHPEARPGPYVLLSVRDTGQGMEPEALSHVFEPFFIQDEGGKGTGLGMASVYGIVRQSGGFIEASSHVGSGSIFHLYFPASQETAMMPPAKPAAPARSVARGRGETLLVVEDEAAVRSWLVRTLEANGYQVLEAPGPAAAYQIAAARGGAVDLLITAAAMPGGGGREAIVRLRGRQPNLRALVISGHGEDSVLKWGPLGAPLETLTKPFSPTTLLERVRRLLDT